MRTPELTERQTMSKKDKDAPAEHEKEQAHQAPEPGMTPREPEQPPPHEVENPVENLEERERKMEQDHEAPGPGVTPREPEQPPSKD
jgi:hypothetical protein